MAAPPRDPHLIGIVSARLRELLARTKTTKSALAYDLRVPYKLVHNWERGNNLPNVNYIIRLAEHFGVSTDYLLGVSDDGRQRRRAAATSADAAGATLEVLEAAEQLHPPTESTRSPARKPRT